MAFSVDLTKLANAISDPYLDSRNASGAASRPGFSGRTDVAYLTRASNAAGHGGGVFRERQGAWRSRGSRCLDPNNLSSSISTRISIGSSRRRRSGPTWAQVKQTAAEVEGSEKVPNQNEKVQEKKDEGQEEKEEEEEEEEEGEVDVLMEGVTFSELCNDFECISSPAVERTARQLAKDILEVKEEKRLLSCYGVYCKYKDPLRSFTGREKYKRPSWFLNALSKPKVVLLQMVMRTTSQLTIRWRLRGNFLLPGASQIGGPLTLTVTSTYDLNTISGQVTDQVDEWELAGSNPAAAAYFWTSRLAWTVAESGRDAKEAMEGVRRFLDSGKEGGGMGNIYADPSDPRKFFQDSNPNSEIYQIGLVLALLYLLVTFLQQVL